MKALKFTPLIALKQRALGALLNETVELLAKEIKTLGEEIPPDIIRRDLWEFVVFSTRAHFDAQEVDFELAKANDSAEVLTVKYLTFLASEHSKRITEAWTAIYQMDGDLPSDPTSTPSEAETDDKGK